MCRKITETSARHPNNPTQWYHELKDHKRRTLSQLQNPKMMSRKGYQFMCFGFGVRMQRLEYEADCQWLRTAHPGAKPGYRVAYPAPPTWRLHPHVTTAWPTYSTRPAREWNWRSPVSSAIWPHLASAAPAPSRTACQTRQCNR